MNVMIPDKLKKRIREDGKALPEVLSLGDFLEFIAAVPVEHQVAAEENWNDWVAYHRDISDAFIDGLRSENPLRTPAISQSPDEHPKSQSGHPMLEGKLSISRAAKVLGVGQTTLRSIIADGEIPHIRIRGKYLILEADLAEYIRSHRSEKQINAPSLARPRVPDDIRNSPLLSRESKI